MAIFAQSNWKFHQWANLAKAGFSRISQWLKENGHTFYLNIGSRSGNNVTVAFQSLLMKPYIELQMVFKIIKATKDLVFFFIQDYSPKEEEYITRIEPSKI